MKKSIKSEGATKNTLKKLRLPRFFILILFCLLFITSNGQNRNSNTYSNPVIPGDIPDPSIIRVGSTYYATGTSFDFGPNYPIYESTDLINWKRIASVFNELPKWASNDFWAPELFYKEGTFFVYYTAKRRDNRIACIGVATTKDIHNGFTDHGIIIEWGEEAIDAFVYQDDDKKLYITWKAYGLTKGHEVEILASELSNDGLSLIGDYFTLTDHTQGWQGAGDEGQCLVKHDGFYYLFYSVGGCCDNRCDYRVRVARSRNMKSGWEQFPEPILQGGDVWRCPGHGTLVTTPDNRNFYLYHAYNATDFEFIGRQGMLDEVLWNEQTGWPYFKNGQTPSVTAEVPFKNTVHKRDSIWLDDFSTDKNLTFLEWDINYPKPSMVITNGVIHITAQHEGINFLGLRPETGNYRLSAEVIPSIGWSGIGIYSNEKNLMALTVYKSEMILFQIRKGEKEILAKEQIGKKRSVFLRYDAIDGRYFKFFRSENGEDWLPIKIGDKYQVDGTFIAQWGYSPRAGFITIGEAGESGTFSSLQMIYNSETNLKK